MPSASSLLAALPFALFPLVASANPTLEHQLEVSVRVESEHRGHHVQHLQLYGPDGELLSQTSHPFAVGVARRRGESAAAVLEEGYELKMLLPVDDAAVARYGKSPTLKLVAFRAGSETRSEFDVTVTAQPDVLRSAK